MTNGETMNTDALSKESIDTDTMIRDIRGKLTIREMIAQVAEESAELTHAALKYNRSREGNNPTPVTTVDAFIGMMEEVADLLVSLDVLMTGWQVCDIVRNTYDRKLARWHGRVMKD